MLKQIMSLLNFMFSLASAEPGQGIIEYALILFLFVVALIVMFGTFGTTLQSVYGYIAAAFP